MPKITISYRREDSIDITGRIFDRLASHYGRQSIFRDIDNIVPGFDFREHIDKALQETDILIVVVGQRWFGPSEQANRIQDEADPVRIEVEAALRRRIPVIPILVSSATMPRTSQLPESLRDFAFRHAVPVDSGRDFDHHVAGLLRAMDGILSVRRELAPPDPPPAPARVVETKPEPAPAAARVVEKKIESVPAATPDVERRIESAPASVRVVGKKTEPIPAATPAMETRTEPAAGTPAVETRTEPAAATPAVETRTEPAPAADSSPAALRGAVSGSRRFATPYVAVGLITVQMLVKGGWAAWSLIPLGSDFFNSSTSRITVVEIILFVFGAIPVVVGLCLRRRWARFAGIAYCIAGLIFEPYWNWAMQAPLVLAAFLLIFRWPPENIDDAP